jgi:hypothetical protein
VQDHRLAEPPPYATPGALQRKWAAGYCGMSVDAFDKHVRPHVPPRYIGGLRLWRVRDLDAFLDKCPSGVT